MTERSKSGPFKLPRDVCGRIACVLSGFAFLPMSAFFLYRMALGFPKVSTVPGHFFKFLLQEFMLAILFFSSFLLVWGLAAPTWLEHLGQRVAARLALALGIFALASLPLALWSLFVV